MIKIVTSRSCSRCRAVKLSLNKAGYEYEEIDVANIDPEIIAKATSQSLPFIIQEDGSVLSGNDVLTYVRNLTK